MSEISDLIGKVHRMVFEGWEVSKCDLLKFMEIDPESEECDQLGFLSREITEFFFGLTGTISSSIGVDTSPCKMNCKFCALGEEWGLVKEKKEMTTDEVLDIAKKVYSKGYNRITLRTTEFYDIDKLCEMCRVITAELKGCIVTVNTGEIYIEDAVKLYDAGCTGAYHSFRLGEGIDTKFDPQKRLDAIWSAIESPLILSSGVEPIGIEHTNEEIVDRIVKLREMGVRNVSVMKRFNVEGTPMGEMPEISDRRLAQIFAVTRIAGGKNWNVGCHPNNPVAMRWGASSIGVEIGGSPRATRTSSEWTPCNHEEAEKMLNDAGYIVYKSFS